MSVPAEGGGDRPARDDRPARGDRPAREDRPERAERSGGTPEGQQWESVSFEDEFDSEIREEFGDLGPASEGGGNGGRSGGDGGGRRRRRR